MKSIHLMCVVSALVLTSAALTAQIPIPGLCNTGVVGPCSGGPGGGGLQTVGISDLNWQLATPAPSAPSSTPITTVTGLTFGKAYVTDPGGEWNFLNGPASQWIAPQVFLSPGGYYVYQTTFTIPSAYLPSTAVISGAFISDNEGVAVFLNGSLVTSGVVFPGPGDSVSSTFTGSFTLTAVNAPFTTGTNTLVFVIRNRGIGGIDSQATVTGLRVEFNSQLSTVSTTPPQTGYPVYSQDSNLSDFTSCGEQNGQSGQPIVYATFVGGTYLNLSVGGTAGGPTILSKTQTYLPTTAILTAANYPRVVGTDLSTNTPLNPIVVDFGAANPVYKIVVFNSIDHPTSNWDAYQYQIFGGNLTCPTCTTIAFQSLFDPTLVSGSPPFTLTSWNSWNGTPPTLVNNVLTPGAGCTVPTGLCGYTTGYEAYFDFTGAPGGPFQFYAFRPSTFTLNPSSGGENEVELTAVGTCSSFVEVCKSSSSVNPVTGSFTFTSPAFTTMPGSSITVPVGACSGPIPVLAGPVTISEAIHPPQVVLSSVAAFGYNPSTFQLENRLGTTNLPAGTATVTAVTGNVSVETIANFTNQGQAGNLKICKVAGQGITIGTNFSFTATSGASATNPGTSQSYTVPAGPASENGYCVLDSTTFPVGAQVTVAETGVPPGTAVTTSVDLGPAHIGTSVVATIGPGFTEVTFTNSAAPGSSVSPSSNPSQRSGQVPRRPSR